MENTNHEIARDFQGNSIYVLYENGTIHLSDKPFHILDQEFVNQAASTGNYTPDDSEDDGYCD